MTTHRYVLLDGLRGVAALAVVLHHLTDALALREIIPHGALAVDFFFMLSGFVIAYAYDEKFADARIDARGFFVARVIRLYPMLLIGLGLGALAFLVRIATRAEWGLMPAFVETVLLGAALLPSNLVADAGYHAAFALDVPAWSLFFELAANGLYGLAGRRLTRAAAAVLAAIGFVGVMTVTVAHGRVTGGQEWSNFPLGAWRVLFGFFLGVVLYRARVRVRLPPRVGAVLAVACLALALTAPLPPSWRFDGACLAVVFPAIIVLGAQVPVRGAAMQACQLAGALSYPVYLIHYPVVRFAGGFARAHHVHGYGLGLVFFATLVCALALSGVVLRAIDEPLRRGLTRRLRKAAPADPMNMPKPEGSAVA